MPAERLLVVAGDERGQGAHVVRIRAQGRISRALGQLARLRRHRRRLLVVGIAARDEGFGARRVVLAGQLERSRDPAVHECRVRCDAPHAGPDERLEHQLGVELAGDRVVRGQLDRPLHRGGEGGAVEVEGVRMPDRTPDLHLPRHARLEARGPLEQRHGVVQLVASDRQLGRTAQPDDRALRELAQPRLVVRPREVGVLGADGLCVVVRQERRVLVASTAGSLEPPGEARVKAGAPGLREAAVGDLAGQRVRDHPLALAGERRAGAVSDEAALLEHP